MSAPLTPDRVADIIARVADVLEAHDLRYCLVYGTLLGAVRDRDVIPWDHDFDMLVSAADAETLRLLGDAFAARGLAVARRRIDARYLAVNETGVADFDAGSVSVLEDGEKVGDIYAFHLFEDGVLRRFDFETAAYWCPHSSFPHAFVDALSEVDLRGRAYPAPAEPEKFLEGVYGADWRTPYRAAVVGGEVRPGTTIHGDRYEPKLRDEVAWWERRGWDRARYRGLARWPRPVAAAGPRGPTPRSEGASGALWWRTLAELGEHF